MIVAAGGTTVTVTSWVAVVILVGSIAAGMTAIAVFVRTVLLPAISAVATLREHLPILNDIAETYGQGGRETISRELQALAANDQVAAANQQQIIARQGEIAARLETVIAKADMLDAKLKTTRHDVIGDIASLRGEQGAAVTLIDSIERTSATLQEVKDHLAELATQLAEMKASPPTPDGD